MLHPLPYWLTHIILKIEAAGFSKILVSYCNITWCHNPEDLDLKNTDIFQKQCSALGWIFKDL
jgi:hypothetical protein